MSYASPATADLHRAMRPGRYRQALDVYIALAEAHNAEHLRRRERPETDTFLQRGRRG